MSKSFCKCVDCLSDEPCHGSDAFDAGLYQCVHAHLLLLAVVFECFDSLMGLTVILVVLVLALIALCMLLDYVSFILFFHVFPQ